MRNVYKIPVLQWYIAGVHAWSLQIITYHSMIRAGMPCEEKKVHSKMCTHT